MAGQLSDVVPPGPDNLARRVAALERRVAQMDTARTLDAAQIGSGGITITTGGSVKVVDTDGHVVAIIGSLPEEYDRSDGSEQPGVVFYREDGSIAALLADNYATILPYKQSFQIHDRAGNVIVADDADSGQGLAAPIVTMNLPVNADPSTWPGTTSSDWTDIALTFIVRQNPSLDFSMYIVTDDPSTTGNIRILVDGVLIGTSPTVTDSFASWYANYPWPSGWTYKSGAAVQIQAQRTAGTGKVRAQVYFLTGDQTP